MLFLLTSLKSICFWCLKYYGYNTGDDHISLLTQPGLHLRLLIWTRCAFAKCCLVIEVTFISSPILLRSNRMWCSNQLFVCVCVSWSGGFSIRGFECCGLLWCNTGATDTGADESEAAANDRWNAPFSTCSTGPFISHRDGPTGPDTLTHITHANQLLAGSLGNRLQNPLSCAPSLFPSLSVSLTILLLSWANPSLILFLTPWLTKKGKEELGEKALCRPLPSTWSPVGAERR